MPTKHICPNWPQSKAVTDAETCFRDIPGCGHEFEQEPDWEGWVDCPSCGMAFNADQAAAERAAIAKATQP